MTDKEWKQVEQRLTELYCSVRLKIDGYSVVLTLERVDTYRNKIMVYVNDEFRFIWVTQDCEERRRFLQEHKRSTLSRKEAANFKALPKEVQKELLDSHNMQYYSYSPLWTSFRALKSHLIKNNKSIELETLEEE